MASKSNWTGLIVLNKGLNEVVNPHKIDDAQWTSASDVEPLIDGVRRRRGSAAENPGAPLQKISLGVEQTGDSDRPFQDSLREYIAQSFKTSAVTTVRRAAVRLRATAGDSPTGTVNAALYTDSGGDPDTVIAGADFTDFSSFDTASMTEVYHWFPFELNTPVGLSANTTYHLVIRHLGASADTIEIEESSTNPYADGNVSFSTNGSSWTTAALVDANFRIYGENAIIRAIADYRLSDGSANRHLVVANQELYKNVDGVFTSVSDRDLVGLDGTVNLGQQDDASLPSWAVGQDRIFVSDNTNFSNKFYIRDGTEYFEGEGLNKPLLDFTLSTAGGNTLPDGEYVVDYYFWNDDIGVAGERRYEGVAEATNTITLTSNHISVDTMSGRVSSSAQRATHIRLELREVGSSVFRLVKEIPVVAGATTSTTIDSTDLPTTIEAEYGHRTPPKHKIKCIAENRQFIANVAPLSGVISGRAPFRVMFSAIFGVTPYYESFPDNNYRDFGQGDDDYVTALFFMPPRLLIVGMKNSIYAIDARRPHTSDKQRISETVGIAGHLAGVVDNGTLYFLSNSAQARGFYRWSPGERDPVRLRGADRSLALMDATRFELASCVKKGVDADTSQWWTLLTPQDKTKHSRIFVYDTVLDAWTIYTKSEGRELYVLGVAEESGIDHVFGGGYEGIEYKQDTTDEDDDGVGYTGSFKTKMYDFGAAFIEKRLRNVGLLYTSDNGIDMRVDTDHGHGDTVNEVFPATAVDKLVDQNTRTRFQSLDMEFSDDSPWQIKGMAIDAQGTGRD